LEIISLLNYFSVFLTLIYVVVVAIFIRGWARINYFQTEHKVARTRVSILIAARNEEESIGNTIADLLAQTYDKSLTEIIVIDDHSTDSTSEIISSFAKDGVILIKLVESKALNSYKKKAIQTAITQSTGQLMVATDADCRMGPKWLETVVEYYETHQYKMISSPVAYFKGQNIFEKIQALEFAYLIGLGASTIGNQNPSTCNGANLAYEKTAFFEVGGFKGIDDLASGDDELLLHKMAAMYEGKIGFLKNREAIVYTSAKPTLREFIQQRRRWASKSTRYKDKSVIILGVSIWIFNLSIIFNGLLLAFGDKYSINFLLFQLILKMIVEFIFLNGVMGFFRRKQLLVLLPLLSLLHVLYMVYIGIAGNAGKYSWKGRTVK
jgi:cellulose synthase/poly-beta-1,6-N-acetylglucosamine synthase-like glycosyltransferase